MVDSVSSANGSGVMSAATGASLAGLPKSPVVVVPPVDGSDAEVESRIPSENLWTFPTLIVLESTTKTSSLLLVVMPPGSANVSPPVVSRFTPEYVPSGLNI